MLRFEDLPGRQTRGSADVNLRSVITLPAPLPQGQSWAQSELLGKRCGVWWLNCQGYLGCPG